MNSFILNSEAIIHICNFFSCFKIFIESDVICEHVLADDTLLSIENYSSVDIHLNENEDKIEILQEIYYVSKMKINIISVKHFNRKNYIFHVELNQQTRIKRDNMIFIYSDFMKDQYIAEYNSSFMSEFFHLNDSVTFISAVLSSLSESLSFQRNTLSENLCLTDTSEFLFHCFNMKL